MSRVANNHIVIPSGVEIKVNSNQVVVKGKLGELKQDFDPNLVQVDLKDNELNFVKKQQTKNSDALSGTLRSIVANMVKGVSEGFEKKLQLIGVGYRAQVKGRELNLSLGYSHPILFPIPDGINVTAPSATEIVISGFNKQLVGQTAAKIRGFRSPEPYKGKGVRYTDERIIIKEVKKK